MSTYVIGDVQGCFSSLEKLLEQVGFDQHKDYLWFTGDLVNRGPQSLEVLRFVKSLGNRAITVLGNHDLHLLAIAEGFQKEWPSDTLMNILIAPDREELLNWLRSQPLMIKNFSHDVVLVHAGIPPQWSIQEALKYADEIHQLLIAPDYKKLLASLYGNQPNEWSEQLKGAERWRYIINAFTRLRFCTIKGLLDFKANCSLHEPPGPHFYPWFDIPNRKTKSETILFGHWAALIDDWSLFRLRKDVYPLDGGCVWGRKLCALRLEDRHFFEVNA